MFTLGFAAETTDMEAAARAKRERKGLSMIAGNVVGPDKAFGRDDNELLVIWEVARNAWLGPPRPIWRAISSP